MSIVEAMLTNKADVNAQDVQGRTPLHCAVAYGRTQVSERLLQQEAMNLAATDRKKQTALHHATCGGSADCVRLLIHYGAPLNQADKVRDVPI